MQLTAYLQRIGYSGPHTPSYTTLCALHRAHLLAIPYENLDIHLGRRLTLNLEQIYSKIVETGRGGWCYEMNGLFAWALGELGFDVTLLGSSVGAPAQGGLGDLDHLVLLVQLEQPWLVDVGFGTAFLEPLPLAAGEHRRDWMTFRLEQQGEAWYFHNHTDRGPGYGFTLQPRPYSGFAPRCHELQTLPESGFVRTTVCHRFTPQGVVSLRGAVLKQYTQGGVIEEEVNTLPRYQELLQQTFGLDSRLADSLWDGVQERHRLWKQSNAT